MCFAPAFTPAACVLHCFSVLHAAVVSAMRGCVPSSLVPYMLRSPLQAVVCQRHCQKLAVLTGSSCLCVCGLPVGSRLSAALRCRPCSTLLLFASVLLLICLHQDWRCHVPGNERLPVPLLDALVCCSPVCLMLGMIWVHSAPTHCCGSVPEAFLADGTSTGCNAMHP